MRKFHSYQLLFLIPGVLLVLASTYYPTELLYKQIMWTKTEALFLQVESEKLSEDTDVYDLMEFKDKEGNVHTIKVYDMIDNDYAEGSDKDHFILYYNPRNPSDYIMMNFGKYMVILFLPFGLLCSYLGWPRKEDKA